MLPYKKQWLILSQVILLLLIIGMSCENRGEKNTDYAIQSVAFTQVQIKDHFELHNSGHQVTHDQRYLALAAFFLEPTGKEHASEPYPYSGALANYNELFTSRITNLLRSRSNERMDKQFIHLTI